MTRKFLLTLCFIKILVEISVNNGFTLATTIRPFKEERLNRIKKGSPRGRGVKTKRKKSITIKFLVKYF